MVAAGHEGVEQPDLHVRPGGQAEQQRIQLGRVEVVQQQTHPDPAPGGVAQLSQDQLAGLVVAQQVVLQVERGLGAPDQLQPRVQREGALRQHPRARQAFGRAAEGARRAGPVRWTSRPQWPGHRAMRGQPAARRRPTAGRRGRGPDSEAAWGRPRQGDRKGSAPDGRPADRSRPTILLRQVGYRVSSRDRVLPTRSGEALQRRIAAMRFSAVPTACLLLAAWFPAQAQEQDQARAPEAHRRWARSRSPHRPARRHFDVAGSVDRVEGAAMRDSRLGVNLSESLSGVPGPADPGTARTTRRTCRSPSAASARAHLRRARRAAVCRRHPGHLARRPGPDLQHRHRLRGPRRGAARPVLGALRQLVGRRGADLHRRPARGRPDSASRWRRRASAPPAPGSWPAAPAVRSTTS